jgi:formate hydrogenlyase subunit 4
MSRLPGYLVLIAASFLFTGIAARVKAWWAGRKGAPLLQEAHDLRKLLRKGEVISRTTTFVFRLNPAVQMAAVVFAALFVPLPGQSALLYFSGDFVLFAYALGLAKFMAVLAALDTGSSFEGMGASREIVFSTLVEPAFFILLGSLALVTGQTSFEAILSRLDYGTGGAILVKSLCVISLFIMLLVEGSRGPVDDPTTHLELTMIHEVMILDYSGPDLAMIVYAAGGKMVLIATMTANLLIPSNIRAVVGALGYAGALALTAAAVGAVEALMARTRMSHVPQFVFIMTALALTTFAVLLFYLRGGF